MVWDYVLWNYAELKPIFLSKGQAIITSSKDWVVGPENGQYYIYADILGGWVKKTL